MRLLDDEKPRESHAEEAPGKHVAATARGAAASLVGCKPSRTSVATNGGRLWQSTSFIAACVGAAAAAWLAASAAVVRRSRRLQSPTLRRLLAVFLVMQVPPVAHASNSFGSRAELLTAVDAWCTNAPSAELQYGGSIADWDVSRVTDMSYLFCGHSSSSWAHHGCSAVKASCSPDLSRWDVSSVTSMYRMFLGARIFTSDLRRWDVSRVIRMDGMFYRASSFTSDLSAWNVSSVTSMYQMFQYANGFTSHHKALIGSAWAASSAFRRYYGAWSSDAGVFDSRAELLTAVDAWCTDAASAELQYGSIADWDVSRVTDMSYLFCGSSWNAQYGCNAVKASCSPDLSRWDVSSVTSMSNLFEYASSFTSDLSAWDVSSVTDMNYMFSRAWRFTSDLSAWNVSSVTSMRYMFFDASSFTSDLSAWNVSDHEHGLHVLRRALYSSLWALYYSWHCIQRLHQLPQGADRLSVGGQTPRSAPRSAIHRVRLEHRHLCVPVAPALPALSSRQGICPVCHRRPFHRRRHHRRRHHHRGTFGNRAELLTAVDAWCTDAASAELQYGGSIADWDVSRVTDMSYLFCGSSYSSLAQYGCKAVKASCSPDLSRWDVSSVTSMSYMFYLCQQLHLGSERLGRVERHQHELHVPICQQLHLGSERLGRVERYQHVPHVLWCQQLHLGSERLGRVERHQHELHVPVCQQLHLGSERLGRGRVERHQHELHVLSNASSFTSDLSAWNVSSVTSMLPATMFGSGASSFTSDLSAWDVSSGERRVAPA